MLGLFPTPPTRPRVHGVAAASHCLHVRVRVGVIIRVRLKVRVRVSVSVRVSSSVLCVGVRVSARSRL